MPGTEPLSMTLPLFKSVAGEAGACSTVAVSVEDAGFLSLTTDCRVGNNVDVKVSAIEGFGGSGADVGTPDPGTASIVETGETGAGEAVGAMFAPGRASSAAALPMAVTDERLLAFGTFSTGIVDSEGADGGDDEGEAVVGEAEESPRVSKAASSGELASTGLGSRGVISGTVAGLLVAGPIVAGSIEEVITALAGDLASGVPADFALSGAESRPGPELALRFEPVAELDLESLFTADFAPASPPDLESEFAMVSAVAD